MKFTLRVSYNSPSDWVVHVTVIFQYSKPLIMYSTIKYYMVNILSLCVTPKDRIEVYDDPTTKHQTFTPQHVQYNAWYLISETVVSAGCQIFQDVIEFEGRVADVAPRVSRQDFAGKCEVGKSHIYRRIYPNPWWCE